MLLLMSQLNLLHQQDVVIRRAATATSRRILIRRRLDLDKRVEGICLSNTECRFTDTLGISLRHKVWILRESRLDGLGQCQRLRFVI